MKNNWQNETLRDANKLGWLKYPLKKRESEYSPSSMIGGNYKPFIDEYKNKSHLARSKAKSEIYQYGISSSHKIEITVSDTSSNNELKPLLIFIHGGYWQELSLEESFFPAIHANKNKIGFAAINYTLAPKATIDQIVYECQSAIEWIFTHCNELGFDSKKIVISGSSAGAHLAAMHSLKRKPTNNHVGNILVSGIYDIQPLIKTSVDEALCLDLDEALRNSPLFYELKDFPPTIVAWGEIETDQFKKQSKIFANKLIEDKIPVRTLEVKNKNHFDVILDLADYDTPLGMELKMLLDFQD